MKNCFISLVVCLVFGLPASAKLCLNTDQINCMTNVVEESEDYYRCIDKCRKNIPFKNLNGCELFDKQKPPSTPPITRPNPSMERVFGEQKERGSAGQ